MAHRLVLLAVVVSSMLARSAAAEDLTAAKSADIKRLMEMTGSANLAQQFAAAGSQQMFQVLKVSRPEIPERALSVMHAELLALISEKLVAPGGLVDLVVPIYHKHLTHQEIRELIGFYQTPLGRKTIEVLPRVVNESMATGQQWGQALAPEIERRIGAALRREGLIP